ncbi:MAG: 1-(5-phosphoribosyl)-5-[(5-phosphoribosylamino)methylideneamino]imidazole-4-carboxamide isomerase [Candidatus Acidiferrum sp.]
MQIYPAIDLRGGRCVRLRQGDYEQETSFSADPVATAQRWVTAGAAFLHLVDLDGARQGQPVNGESIRAIVARAGVPCQLGGGIRTDEHIAEVLSWGVIRLILGTKALQDPNWFEANCRKYPGQIVLGLDAKAGKVATDGWRRTSAQLAVHVARRYADWPIAAIVYTDIAKDGMLEGPNVDATAELAMAVPIPVIASGGVTTVTDVEKLARRGIAGCIIGRALYEGRIELSAALEAARKEPPKSG